MNQQSRVWQEQDPARVVTWTPSDPARTIEGPLALELFADRLLILELACDQVALLVVDGHVKRVLLDGRHEMYVDPVTDDGPRGQLVFLRRDVPLAWRWTRGAVLHVELAGRPEQTLGLRGSCGLQVINPTRLYATVLAGLDDLPADTLRDVFDTLVRANLERRLHDLAESSGLDRVRAEVTLERLEPADLDDDLAELGLVCSELNASLAPETAPADVTATSPLLVSSYDDVF